MYYGWAQQYRKPRDPCPLCETPAPPFTACIGSACKHGHYPPSTCYRCHPEKCPHHSLLPWKDAMPKEVISIADEQKMMRLDSSPIPYRGEKYERSDVQFIHLPLMPYLEKRGIALPEQLEALVAHMPAGTFIAGGSVAALTCGRPIQAASDIDLFFANQKAFAAACKLLAFAGKQVTGPQVPDGVVMFEAPDGRDGLPVQAINIAYFDSIDELLDGFDFTCTHFGIDVASKELVFTPAAVTDYICNRLLNHRDEGDQASSKRIAKYIAKGFKPVGPTLARAVCFGLWNLETGKVGP